jgi:DNA repair protein RecN (Recombination protein N)
MLTTLTIRNYALIDELEIEFQEGFTTITGETGAGKSILLGALGLVLGKRSDTSSLMDTEKKCVIEAQFNIAHYNLNNFFEEHEIDFEENTILRREILPSSKSRAFINDMPVSLAILQKLSVYLVDIHSQHQTMQLADNDFQYNILDAVAGTQEQVASYKRGLVLFKKSRKELQELKERQEEEQKNHEYHLQLFNELKEAEIQTDEQTKIEEELKTLNNIEEIKLNFSTALGIAQKEEVGLEQLLSSFAKNIDGNSVYNAGYKELSDRVKSIQIEFADILSAIDNNNEELVLDDETLQSMKDRIQLLYTLQQKHSVADNKGLLAIFEQLASKVQGVESFGKIIEEKEAALEAIEKKIEKLSSKLFELRKKAIPVLTSKMEALLSELRMENTRVQFNLNNTENYGIHGKDELKLLLSANKGLSFGELKKVASGGELSRIMLTVKAILSEYKTLPTIIFDEIDTGVSGDASQKMAIIMMKMSEKMQVIAVTHLPQIASKGLKQFKVYKEDNGKEVKTRVKQLAFEERVAEIAEMISGKAYSKTAVEHAKELLG